MSQSGIHIGDVRKLLHRVVDDWRLIERKAVRDRLRDCEDRLEKLEYRRAQSGTADMKARLIEQRDRFRSRIDARNEMLDEAHRQMAEFIDNSEANAN
ncbi:hypothetical protein [Aurantiacibacter sediminis]|uniref:Uncharacterized protein n=1 Tax=Aurantiacibacter sediminis TaxID=2793064 RepID=A0ABS0N517_9SPHN|nr:hypothetical protein [Aurantiacibacter sediminis]MBH5322889.1 hypothetical protein [Aurantiacibacter sediminis]